MKRLIKASFKIEHGEKVEFAIRDIKNIPELDIDIENDTRVQVARFVDTITIPKNSLSNIWQFLKGMRNRLKPNTPQEVLIAIDNLANQIKITYRLLEKIITLANKIRDKFGGGMKPYYLDGRPEWKEHARQKRVELAELYNQLTENFHELRNSSILTDLEKAIYLPIDPKPFYKMDININPKNDPYQVRNLARRKAIEDSKKRFEVTLQKYQSSRSTDLRELLQDLIRDRTSQVTQLVRELEAQNAPQDDIEQVRKEFIVLEEDKRRFSQGGIYA